jgi:hypothetical protein
MSPFDDKISYKITAVVAVICFAVQFVSRPYIGNLSTYLFGGLGGFFSVLTIIFLFKSIKTRQEQKETLLKSKGVKTETPSSEKTIKPLIAGIILIIIGSILTYIFASAFIQTISEVSYNTGEDYFQERANSVYDMLIILLIVFEIVMIVGGVMAIIRKMRGFALISCALGFIPTGLMFRVTASFNPFLSGIFFLAILSLALAMILLVKSKSEFPIKKTNVSDFISPRIMNVSPHASLRIPKEYDNVHTFDGRTVSLRTLSVYEGKFLELSLESINEYDFSLGFRNNNIGPFIGAKDMVYSFWPFIDSPLADTKETIWTKDIKPISSLANELSHQCLLFSNKPDQAAQMLQKIRRLPIDWDLFYLSQDNFFAYYRIEGKLDSYIVDNYVKNFGEMVKTFENTRL